MPTLELADRFKFLGNHIELLGECIELCELDIQFTLPQFVVVTSAKGLRKESMCVVLVCLAFDVRPLPGIFVGRADECFEPQADCQVVDPARRTTGFHDDEVNFVFLKDCGEVLSVSGSIKEFMFTSFRVEKAAHGIEFTEVQSENFHSSFCPTGLGLEECDSGCLTTTQDHGSESPDFNRRLPPQTQDLHGFFLRLELCPNISRRI